MVRSYGYAAYAALFAFTSTRPIGVAPLEVWADAWQHWVAEAFLDGYRTTARNARLCIAGRRMGETVRCLPPRPSAVRTKP